MIDGLLFALSSVVVTVGSVTSPLISPPVIPKRPNIPLFRTMAAAAYNFGRTGMRKQIERQGTGYYYDLTLGEETGRYVFRILALKLIFEHPERYGFVLDSADFYAPLRYTEVTVDSSISRLADFAAKEGTNYKMLKYFNPWLRDSFLPNVKHKSYSIKIPVEGYRTNPYNK